MMTTAEKVAAGAMMAAARAETGLDDFGDDLFVEPLERFLASASTESGLSPEGMVGLQMDVGRLLVNRLRYTADLTAHPEINDEQVDDPIVVVGIPRTGTTKLQRLMAASPETQSVTLWRLLFPAPFPQPGGPGEPGGPAGPGAEDPRIELARQFQEELTSQAPHFMAAHTMRADEPEEEALLAQMTFDRLGAFDWFYDTPSYHRYLAERPQDHAYGYVRGILRYLQWQDPANGTGSANRPWVLKTPLHTGNIATLFSVFPKATVVHCHRDPMIALSSFCSFVEIIRTTRGHTVIDREALGDFLLGELSGHWRRNLEQRADLADFKDQILDVRYADICDDPITCVRDIYRSRGAEVSDETAGQMLAWDRANPPGQFGRHDYSPADYGLSESRVREAFVDYYQHFGG